MRPGDAAVQQHGRADGPVTDRLQVGDLVPHRRGAVDLDRVGRARDHDLIGVPQRGAGDGGVVLDLRRVDDHHVIVAGDVGQAAVQLAGRQRHDPEREGRLRRREPRVHGGQIGPLQGAARRVGVHQQDAVPARANTCASQTAEVVLPVPGLRLAKARLRPVIQAVCQQPRYHGQAGPAGAIDARRWPVRQPGNIAPAACPRTVLHSLWTPVEIDNNMATSPAPGRRCR